MHDEEKDLLFLVVILFLFAIAITLYIASNMKADHREVKTLISHYLHNRPQNTEH